MNDITEELMILDTEPKPESRTKAEEVLTFEVGGRGTSLMMPFVEVFDLQGEDVEARDGKLVEGCSL